ncbi:hypothetical protein [Streptomyces flavidovirens]|uniref:hypothetical protein n=1 Tax=Streptomyces flavidovirens TaxID=67298 RepID=UPI000428866A|nr:hypothetical protein [Streptomyces flavidovirens]
MTPITLAAIRAALRATTATRTTPFAIALRAAVAAQHRQLSPADESRCARDLLDAARGPGGYTYGPVPASDQRWDADAAGYARQEVGIAPPNDVDAALAAIAHLADR